MEKDIAASMLTTEAHDAGRASEEPHGANRRPPSHSRADRVILAVQSVIVGLVGNLMCACGSHDQLPYRSLTRRSREFRCIRCEKRFVEVMERWVEWPLQGGRPYGTGPDSIGESLAWRGLNVKEEMADQTPHPSWIRSREGWLACRGETGSVGRRLVDVAPMDETMRARRREEGEPPVRQTDGDGTENRIAASRTTCRHLFREGKTGHHIRAEAR